MAQWLRVLATFPEDLGWVPSTDMVSQLPVFLVLENLMLSSGYFGALTTSWHKHIHKSKNRLVCLLEAVLELAP